jgi:drug/metabolite transporter (DMT)-like permease
MRSLKQHLLDQADNPRRNLNRVLSGAAVFFLGLALIYLANHDFTPSLEQELVALMGLVLTVIGGILAAVGYISLSILRIFKIIDDDHD